MWKHFIAFVLAGMVVAQLTLIGLLALKQSPYAGPALGPLLAVTILFIVYINSKHNLVSEHLPTRDCILKDLENFAEGEMDMEFAKGVYLQPSLQNKPVEPEYDNDDQLYEPNGGTQRSVRGSPSRLMTMVSADSSKESENVNDIQFYQPKDQCDQPNND